MAIQLSSTAVSANSAWMVGRATFTEEMRKGPMNEVRVATVSAERSTLLLQGVVVVMA